MAEDSRKNCEISWPTRFHMLLGLSVVIADVGEILAAVSVSISLSVRLYVHRVHPRVPPPFFFFFFFFFFFCFLALIYLSRL